MNSTLPLVFFSAFCAVGGQLLIKAGTGPVGALGADALANPLAALLRIVSSPMLIAGLGCYVAGAASWIVVLSRLPLSLAYPIVAVSYAITPIMAWLLFGESVPAIRWAGIGAICLGIILVSRS
jgi:drug/metabolite transporter (DMT)-like permease